MKTKEQIISRDPYIPSKTTKSFARAEKLGVKCWKEKRTHEPDEAERNLRMFIDINVCERYYYGITYKGKDYICGDLPRDIGTVLLGIEIAESLK
jgi:hypothetical protein